jgi:hypothetical protein
MRIAPPIAVRRFALGDAVGWVLVNGAHCSGPLRSFTTRRNARSIRSWASSSP